MRAMFDIDGVIADPSEQMRKYLPDWAEFYRHTTELSAIKPVCKLIDMLVVLGNTVFFCTGRPSFTYSDTKLWITKNTNIDSEQVRLFMRPPDNEDPTHMLKLAWAKEIKPDFIVEDEPRAVRLLTDNGFLVLQVCGLRLTDEDSVPFKEWKGLH